jgi:hypothetical protein
MSFSTVTQSSIMKLLFQAVAMANYADNAASTPQTNVATSLQTADPGDAGTMSTNEIAYTGYARVNVARTTGGWAENGSGVVSPVATIAFPAGTGGSGTATYATAGKTGGGAAAILISGPISPTIVTGNGVTPQLGTGSTATLD